MNILITGASGLIGSHLIQRLSKDCHNIFCQSRSFQKTSGVKWIKHDLVHDRWEDLGLPTFDIVYHLAAQTSVNRAKELPIEDLSVNVIGLLRLLEYLRKQSKQAFIVFAGTATEVGLTDRLPISESFKDSPITFYDLSKLTSEMYLKQYIREGWVKGCSLRLANVYGKSMKGQQHDRGIIDRVFNRAILGQNITIYGNGEYIRDYIYIEDVISAFLCATEKMEVTNGRSFFIGTGYKLTLKDAFLKVVDIAEKKTGSKVIIKYVRPPADLSEMEFRNALIDSSAFRQATGWSPKFNFESGIKAAYDPIVFSGKKL